MSKFRVTFGSALAAAALLVAAPADAQRTVDGHQYTFRIETGGDDSEVVTGRAWVAGDRARIEVDGSAKRRRVRGANEHVSVQMEDGEYFVVDGRTMHAVKPSEREYSTTTVDEFERIVGRAMKAADAVLTLEVRELDVTGQKLGPGEPILGHPTQKGRLVAEYVARIGAFGFATSSEHSVQTEYWVAPALSLPRNPLAEMLVGLPTVLAQHDDDFVTRMRAGRRAMVGNGTPLRVVLTAESREEKGERSRMRASYEVTSLTRAKVDPALFEVPRGYRKTNGFSIGTGRGR